jgi:glycerol kinase
MADDPLILAVDQGTSATKAVLVSRTGAVVARGQAPVGQAHPRPGWVEQSAEEIRDSVSRAIDGMPLDRVAGLAISNQRESMLLWERESGRPLGPMLSWQDQRTAAACARLAGSAPLVQSVTGLPLDPMFSALKAQWLLDTHDPERKRAEAGELCLGTVDSWLLFSPGGPHVVEAGNASRTQLLDIAACAWDSRLLDLFGVPAAVLPDVVPSRGPFPDVPRSMHSLPVLAVLADSHAALFANAGWRSGVVKVTYGTGSSVMGRVSGALAPPGVCRTIAWDAGELTYALEGNIRSTGATLVWLAKLLGSTPEAVAELGASAGSAGVHIVPAFNGLGAPWWDSTASGLVTGLTLGSGAPQLARAALESIAYQIEDVVHAMEPATGRIDALLADGGPTANATLMQLQADLSGRTVQCPADAELSALGAARLGGLGLGWWSCQDLESFARPSRSYEPALPAAEREARLADWHAALIRARDDRSL